MDFKNYKKMAGIKVFIVDDHEVVVLGIKSNLVRHKDIQVAGWAFDGLEAIKKIKDSDVDIVLMDVKLPDITGIEAAKKIKEFKPDIKILFHSSVIDEKTIIDAFELGASGYVPKSYKVDEIAEAVRIANTGKKYLKGIVSEIFLENYLKTKEDKEKLEKIPLTNREIEVLQQVAHGLSNKQVAAELNISLRTVEVHKSNIMKKLELYSTAELVIYAIKKDLITI